MSNLAQVLPTALPVFGAANMQQNSDAATSKSMYLALGKEASGIDQDSACRYLSQQLAVARRLPVDLPSGVDDLADWIRHRTDTVGVEYRNYLALRKNGGPRRYFSNKSHALYFLKSVAPTKLVDGAWLYGVLQRWNDPDYHALIKIYLEELGDGVPDKNHVVLYKKLLVSHGCDQWEDLGDEHFVQGAIQLCLAHNAEHFLPELIGYNLGYEQLPLHLLITAYELNELGIDPYYFTLHITVDNAATGHAQNALQGLQQLMPHVGDATAFYRRVMDGYLLNELGASTASVIASFDLDAELVGILAAKSVIGKNMHSDYCRVAGRTVNDWLSDPEQIPAFLESLEQAGWIQRGESAENSRFWRLIQSDKAEMFGVFNAYEQQVLHDWIVASPNAVAHETLPQQTMTYRARQRTLHAFTQSGIRRPQIKRGIIRHRYTDASSEERGFHSELTLLEKKLAELGSKEAAMQMLIKLMSPAHHHTSVGLMATRIFTKLLA